LIIAEGSEPTRVAQEIGTQSRGHTRVVQLGYRGGQRAEPFDIVVTHGHPDLPTDRRRIETVAPLSSPASDHRARPGDSQPPFADAPRPHVVLLVGGSNAQHRLEEKTARRMAEEVRKFAEAAGGTAIALTTSRTGRRATEALRLGMEKGRGTGTEGTSPGILRPSTSEEGLETLASADVVVVTGEDGQLLARAVATGHPVYIYPLPRRPFEASARLARWIETRAHAKPLNRRGTIRPQQGFEYLCARLIERGVISPPLDVDKLHRHLIQRGVALPFGASLTTEPRAPFREAEEVARRVRRLLGRPAAAAL
jgi:mitochondrial fission protein ELM1